MGLCDICGKHEEGTRVSSEDMRTAVFKNKFNPYASGLIKLHHMYGLKDKEVYEGWKRDIVAQDQSDWNICSECMSKLKSYLEDSFRPSDASSSEVRLFSEEGSSAEKEAGQKVAPQPQVLSWAALTISINFFILGIVLLISFPPSKEESLIHMSLLFPGASLFLRSFRPPVGFMRGFVTLVGGFFAARFVWSLIMQVGDDQGTVISYGSLFLSIFLLWIGFRTRTKVVKETRKNEEVVETKEKEEGEFTAAARPVKIERTQATQYEFINPNFFSNRPLETLLGIILLSPVGEAREIASSRVFIGTVEDTVGTWFPQVMKQGSIHAIGIAETESLFNEAASGSPTATKRIIDTGVGACLKMTKGIFPPQPVDKNFYHINAVPENEKTGSCFIILAAYKMQI
jgi:hypothetical protein